MGLFGSSTPFDAEVEKATSEKNTTDDWGLIMDICDKVSSSPSNAKDYLKSIVKRLHNNDPHVAMQAVTLLDACVNNCGKSFHLEIASREFENEFMKLFPRSHPTVKARLRSLLKKWAEGEFKNDPQLNLILSLYQKLPHAGVEYVAPPPSTTRTEDDDLAKAIELSLKEKGSPKVGKSGANNVYPTVNQTTFKSSSRGAPSDARKVRALYDFEAAEDNELTFKAGEIVQVIDDSDPNWWKGHNQRGEGLFPANFVTPDLTVVPEQFRIEAARKKNQYTDDLALSKERSSPPIQPQVVEIDESKIDRLVHLLHEADPNDASKDTHEMKILEEQVNGMGPLIDNELERVDRKHAQLTQLSADLVDALNLYHTLMREPQFSQMPLPSKAMPPPNYYPMGLPGGPPVMYNGNSSFGPPPPGVLHQPMPPHVPGQFPQYIMHGPMPPPSGAMMQPPTSQPNVGNSSMHNMVHGPMQNIPNNSGFPPMGPPYGPPPPGGMPMQNFVPPQQPPQQPQQPQQQPPQQTGAPPSAAPMQQYAFNPQ